MTGQSQVAAFISCQYEIFVGLDVDKYRIAVTFTDHSRLLKSLRLPDSSEQLLNYPNTRENLSTRRLEQEHGIRISYSSHQNNQFVPCQVFPYSAASTKRYELIEAE
jgi:hypothetical protein